MASKWKAGTFTAALLTVASIVPFSCPEGRPRLGVTTTKPKPVSQTTQLMGRLA
jgi:hypothetical protein